MARKRRRLHRRYKRNRSEGGTPRSNPPMAMELVEYIGPGFAGFAATRVLTRLATVQISKRKPSWGKHAGVLASLAAFGAAWWGAHRVKFLGKYAMPITVGAGIAAAQSILQLWLPKIGWVVSDASPELAAAHNDMMMPAGPTVDQITARMQPVEDDGSFSYDPSYEADNYAQTAKRAPNGTAAPVTPAGKKAQAEEDLLVDLNLDEGMGGGVFSN